MLGILISFLRFSDIADQYRTAMVWLTIVPLLIALAGLTMAVIIDRFINKEQKRGLLIAVGVCPKFYVNTKSRCKTEQKILFGGESPLSTV